VCGIVGKSIRSRANVVVVVFEAGAKGVIGAVRVEGVAAEVYKEFWVMSVWFGI
jgi:hypothetical protein